MQNKQHRPSTQETQIAFSILASRNPFPMSFQPEKIRTLFSPSAHVQTAPFAPVPFPLSVNSVDSCKKIQGPSILNRFITPSPRRLLEPNPTKSNQIKVNQGKSNQIQVNPTNIFSHVS